MATVLRQRGAALARECKGGHAGRMVSTTTVARVGGLPPAPLHNLFSAYQPVPWHGAGCTCPAHAGLHNVTTPSAAEGREYAVEVAGSTIRYGRGCTKEVGFDIASLLADAKPNAAGRKPVLVVTDGYIATLPGGPVSVVLDSLHRAGVPASDVTVFDRVAVEPTDVSLQLAIDEAKRVQPAALVAVGGGSVMDTAKAANLYASIPTATLLDFVNAPIGKGKPVPAGVVKPLIAVPTTAGTGSETTGVAIFDYTPLHAKTGIASRNIKPTLGVVDPDNTATMPRAVAVASGFDVLCHALESFTAVPFNERGPAPANPTARPAYQGANLPSDVWASVTLRLLAKHFIRSVKEPDNLDARIGMTYASCFAGYGFGSAGCHLPHAMSYGISGRNRAYVQPGYESIRTNVARDGMPTKPLVPHGISVVLSAPAVFRYTAATNPHRHAEAARLLAGEDVPLRIHLYTRKEEGPVAGGAGAGAALADQILTYMDELGVPNGLSAVGYTADDVPSLVDATLPQKRVLNVAPLPMAAEELTTLFRNSMTVY